MSIIHHPPATAATRDYLDALHYYGFTVTITPPICTPHDVFVVKAVGPAAGAQQTIWVSRDTLHDALRAAASELGDRLDAFLASLKPQPTEDRADRILAVLAAYIDEHPSAPKSLLWAALFADRHGLAPIEAIELAENGVYDPRFSDDVRPEAKRLLGLAEAARVACLYGETEPDATSAETTAAGAR